MGSDFYPLELAPYIFLIIFLLLLNLRVPTTMQIQNRFIKRSYIELTISFSGYVIVYKFQFCYYVIQKIERVNPSIQVILNCVIRQKHHCIT